MKIIAIQFHPNRVPELKMKQVVEFFRSLAYKSKKIDDIRVVYGLSRRKKYVDIYYKTKNLKDAWSEIKEKMLNQKEQGSSLRRGLIIVCEGTYSWDDYLLLYHFDKKQKLDSFAKKKKIRPLKWETKGSASEM